MKAIFSLVMAFFMSIGQILAPVGAVIRAGGEDAFFEDWSSEQTFTREYCVELEKQKGEDFRILNLADIQLEEELVFEKEGQYTYELIKKLVADTDPDLITLSGDNAWATISYLELIKLVDSFGIPWAAVHGNHEGDSLISEFWAAYHMAEAKNSIYKYGPKDMGYGNYIANIVEDGRIVHTLFFMDTHRDAEYELEDGSTVSGYDHLWDNQQEWYKWAVNGIKDIAGHTVQSTVIMHIPVYEYHAAWDMYYTGDDENGLGEIDEKFKPFAYGRKREVCCPAPVNNGFFSLCKELGSTKNIIVGHDHVNDFTALYEGIYLSYAVKTGFGCYWDADMIGATTLDVNSLGMVKLQNHYYDLEENGWGDIIPTE